jgi:hypothetical protein
MVKKCLHQICNPIVIPQRRLREGSAVGGTNELPWLGWFRFVTVFGGCPIEVCYVLFLLYAYPLGLFNILHSRDKRYESRGFNVEFGTFPHHYDFNLVGDRVLYE